MEESTNDAQHQAFANQLAPMIADGSLFQVQHTPHPQLAQHLIDTGLPVLMALNAYAMQNKTKFPAFYEFTLAPEQVPQGSKS